MHPSTVDKTRVKFQLFILSYGKKRLLLFPVFLDKKWIVAFFIFVHVFSDTLKQLKAKQQTKVKERPQGSLYLFESKNLPEKKVWNIS